MINPFVLFPESAPAPATWNYEQSLIDAAFNESQRAVYFKAMYGGSRFGGSQTVIPDPDYVNHPLSVLNAGQSAYTETGIKAIRLTRFDATTPTGGSADSLKSEQLTSTILDTNGKCLYFEKHKSNRLIVFEIDTVARTGTYLKEIDIASLSTNERLFIHPHPTEVDTIFYVVGQIVYKTNIRTHATLAAGAQRVEIVNLGYTPALSANNGDGNGVQGGRILMPEASGDNVVWALNIATGQAVTTVAGNPVLVPVASRTSLTLPAKGTNGLDYAFISADGKYILAICRSTSGPDGGSGIYAYDLAGTYIGKVGNATVHFMGQMCDFTGTLLPSVTCKVTSGLATDLGGGLSNGDHCTICFDIQWTGSAYTLTRSSFRNRATLENNLFSGGQHSAMYTVPNITYLSEKPKYTSVNQIEANYHTPDSRLTECMTEFRLGRANDYRVLGKNLTRRPDGTSKQTEINLIAQGADGTTYLILKSHVGPIEGGTTDIFTNKDIWLLIVPPPPADDRVSYYMALP